MKNGITRHVDLVDIKADVKAGKIVFYVQSGLIYCRDTQNNELVIVGDTNER